MAISHLALSKNNQHRVIATHWIGHSTLATNSSFVALIQEGCDNFGGDIVKKKNGGILHLSLIGITRIMQPKKTTPGHGGRFYKRFAISNRSLFTLLFWCIRGALLFE